MPAVQLGAVSVRYPGAGPNAPALHPLSLRIEAGERVAIIGPSGAGKTTLLHLLATALKPHRGTVDILGIDPWLCSPTQRRALRRQIGLIQQAPPLPPRQRVVTTVAAGRLGQWSLLKSMANLFYPLETSQVTQCLSLLDIDDKLFERCDQLSGGQLQRVAIARVLYQQPQLILADEPVAALDPRLANHSLEVLCTEASRLKATLVASLHAVDLALQHFDRIIGLKAGRVLFDCPPAEIDGELLSELYANESLGQPATMPPATVGEPAQYPCR